MERDWRIVHIAGHGEPPEMLGPVPTKPGDPPQQLINPRGVVLSGESFLGPREIHSMRVVPELVFVNCCHLAARQADEVLGCLRPAALAASVAEELINIGVRCVVAAGWAVEDGPAMTLRRRFIRHCCAASVFSTQSRKRALPLTQRAATPGGLPVLWRSRLGVSPRCF